MKATGNRERRVPVMVLYTFRIANFSSPSRIDNQICVIRKNGIENDKILKE
jgi:hypothetical protein